MLNDINHVGQGEPRDIVRILTLPLRPRPWNASVQVRAVYNYLRHRGGWGVGHHGLHVNTIAKAIGLTDQVCRLACDELVCMVIAEFEKPNEQDPLCRLMQPFVLTPHTVKLDPDIVEYIAALMDDELSFQDIVNWMLAEHIAADTLRAGVQNRVAKPHRISSNHCITCDDHREVLVWTEDGPATHPCPECTNDERGKPVAIGTVGLRHSGQPPVIPLYE